MLQDFAAITSKSACHKQERLSQARVVVTSKSGCHKQEWLSQERAVVTRKSGCQKQERLSQAIPTAALYTGLLTFSC